MKILGIIIALVWLVIAIKTCPFIKQKQWPNLMIWLAAPLLPLAGWILSNNF